MDRGQSSSAAQKTSPACASLASPTSADAALRRELLSNCERIARVWRDRAGIEAAEWADLHDRLVDTRTFAEAFNVYSDSALQRRQMASESVRRLFEEYRSMSRKFSRPAGGCSRDGA